LCVALTLAACGGGAASTASPSSAAPGAASGSASVPASAKPSAAPGNSASAGPSSAASTAGAASSSGAISASAGAAAVPASSAAKPGTTTIRISIGNAITGAPIFVGIDKGAYSAVGLDFQNDANFTNTAQAMVALAAGQLDMGVVTMGAAAFNAFNRGADFKMVASLNQEPPGHGSFTPVIVRTDLYDSGALRTPAQLKGHKVAITGAGTVIEYGLGKILTDNGLKPSDVETVVIPAPTDQILALANKSVDAAMPFEPIASQAIQKGVAKMLSDDYEQNAQLATISVNTKWAASNKDAIVKFLTVYVKQVRSLDDGQIKTDAAALAAIQKWIKVPPAVVKTGPDPFWPKDGRLNLQSLQDEQTFFLNNKSVDYTQPLPTDKLVDEQYITEALKQIGS